MTKAFTVMDKATENTIIGLSQTYKQCNISTGEIKLMKIDEVFKNEVLKEIANARSFNSLINNCRNSSN